MRLVAVDGELEIDGDRRLGGRGVYLCPSPECAERARARGVMGRRLRAAVRFPADLAGKVSG